MRARRRYGNIYEDWEVSPRAQSSELLDEDMMTAYDVKETVALAQESSLELLEQPEVTRSALNYVPSIIAAMQQVPLQPL